jgi:TonB family protein
MMKKKKRWLWMVLLAISVLCGQLAAQDAKPVDPFYPALLEKAQKAFLAKKYEDAARDFEIAAFGLSGNRILKARALVYLGLARYYLKDISSSERRLREAAELMGTEGFGPLDVIESAKADLAKLMDFYGIPTVPAVGGAENPQKPDAPGPPSAPDAGPGQKKPKESQDPAEAIKTLGELKDGDLVPLELVDTRPSLVKRVDPQYPLAAKRMRVGGTVVLNVLISENGDVIKTEIFKGIKGAFGFNQESQRVVGEWKFNPASVKGIKVKVWMPVSVEFRPPQ